MNMSNTLQEAADFIRQQTNLFLPEFGIILGTGLGALVKDIDITYSLDYADIPHFPVSTVESHSGKLIFGELGGRRVVVMQGRFHYYEGYTMQQVVFPVRVMKLLGIQKLFISNAAGGFKEDFELSDLMVITDHINLLPNPLIGKNLDDLGPRFPDMSEPYDLNLVAQALEISAEHGLNAKTGVYASVTGPTLETRAEYKYINSIGADAVGMSTIPEVIAAVHMGLPCFAVSIITDLCSPEKIQRVVLKDILEAAAKAEPKMTLLITELIKRQN
ncbi:purine-nucleoside phosphorylase [Rufibacter soli]|jgi:purine-nucleoside phosphorylase